MPTVREERVLFRNVPSLIILSCGFFACVLFAFNPADASSVRQLTSGPKNHCLDNNENFSPDDRFLCYDTRPPDGNIANGRTIEKVNVKTGEITVLYKAKNPIQDFGPGMGAANYSHIKNEVMFICGKPTETGLRYAKTCRFGRMVDGNGSGKTWILDARDVTFPYTPGALRGGTHRHEPDGTGRYVGYTYNDQIMKALGKDLRTIGVTVRNHPVSVDEDSLGENNDGEGWSVLVVRVTPDPKPGSDGISYAAGDSWVGTHGYRREDGTLQMARAFVGKVRDKNGNEVDELFIVDIPSDLTRPGKWGPLEGTPLDFPQPPAGTVQRRLTFTVDQPHPGIQGIARSSPDGSQISFLMADNNGKQQVFLISPLGGEPRQASFKPEGIALAPRWHPSGTRIVTVDNRNRLLVISVADGDSFGQSTVLTEEEGEERNNFLWSHDGNTIAFNQAVPINGQLWQQIFLVGFRDGDND